MCRFPLRWTALDVVAVSKHADLTPAHSSLRDYRPFFLLVGLVIVLSTNRVAGRRYGYGHLSHKSNFSPSRRVRQKLMIETSIGALFGLRGDGKSVVKDAIQSEAKWGQIVSGGNSSITIGGMRAADISGDGRRRHSTALAMARQKEGEMRSDCGCSCPTHGQQKKIDFATMTNVRQPETGAAE